MINNLNLNHLKTFYAVANSKSFKEASELLFISQPAVSKNIKNLEDVLGVKLFFRSSDGIEITNEGLILFKFVEKSFDQLNAGFRLLESQKQLDTGKIVIGIPSHIASFFLLKHIERFRGDYPRISIEIISSSTKQLIKDLEEHKLDFVIDSSPLDNLFPDMKVEVLENLETCFISTTDIKLDNIQDISNLNLILPIPKSSVRKNLEKDLIKHNITLVPKIEVETTELIISSVKRNLGVGYVIKSAVENELKRGIVKLVEFPDSLPNIDINLVYIESCLTYPSRKIINYYIKPNNF